MIGLEIIDPTSEVFKLIYPRKNGSFVLGTELLRVILSGDSKGKVILVKSDKFLVFELVMVGEIQRPLLLFIILLILLQNSLNYQKENYTIIKQEIVVELEIEGLPFVVFGHAL